MIEINEKVIEEIERLNKISKKARINAWIMAALILTAIGFFIYIYTLSL